MENRKWVELKDIVRRADLHRLLIQEYKGKYSLGVTFSPGGKEALLLRVEEANPCGFATQIIYEGRKIDVVVKGSFRTPKPLSRRKVSRTAKRMDKPPMYK